MHGVQNALQIRRTVDALFGTPFRTNIYLFILNTVDSEKFSIEMKKSNEARKS